MRTARGADARLPTLALLTTLLPAPVGASWRAAAPAHALPLLGRAPPPRLSASPPQQREDATGRVALSVLGCAGAVETGVLTADKLSGADQLADLCALGGGGCSDVLSGPWAEVGGVPLSVFGLVGYTAVAGLAAWPLVTGAREAEAEADASPSSSSSALAFASGALAAFSGCLMLLLLLVIQEPCAFCFASAAISAGILAVAWRTPLLADRTQAAVLTASGAAISVAAAVALYVTSPALAEGGYAIDDGRPPITRAHSSARALELARELNARGGRFFGAYWCSHCANQKETLGIEAMRLVPYLECDANGVDSRRAECQASGIRGYPTWQLDGRLFPGEKGLDEIAEMLAGTLEGTPMPDPSEPSPRD